MFTRRMTFWEMGYVMILGAALPLAGVLLSLGLYAQATWTVALVAFGVALMTTNWIPGARSQPRAVLALQDRVPAPGRPMAVQVVRVAGPCALGFRPGDRWSIDAEGALSSRLCQPAVAALSSALASWPQDGQERVVACRCPLEEREVAFALN